MADSFHRDRGRAWELRQRSLELWSQWRRELAQRGHPLPYRAGVLLLAAAGAEEERLTALGARKRALGLPLELWDRQRLEPLQPTLPQPTLVGLHCGRDGQLDPGAALAALAADGRRRGLALRAEAAVALEPERGGWRVALAGGGAEQAAWVVLAAGTAAGVLLESVPGIERDRWALEPVLGQALELELEAPSPATGLGRWCGGASIWCPVPTWRAAGGCGWGRPWNRAAGPTQTSWSSCASWGAAPAWLQKAQVVHHWQGLRPRPVGQPAPLLEQPAPGLLLAAGHYRNGVLLAPASAAWVAERIEAGRPRA